MATAAGPDLSLVSVDAFIGTGMVLTVGVCAVVGAGMSEVIYDEIGTAVVGAGVGTGRVAGAGVMAGRVIAGRVVGAGFRTVWVAGAGVEPGGFGAEKCCAAWQCSASTWSSPVPTPHSRHGCTTHMPRTQSPGPRSPGLTARPAYYWVHAG